MMQLHSVHCVHYDSFSIVLLAKRDYTLGYTFG